MLPGFRFLFAATMLAISILVFGLGAAALLRAAHEQFAGNTAWHAAPDATFAQQPETARPVLAMLRIDQQPAQPKATVDLPAPVAAAEPEQVAALGPEETLQPDSAQPDLPASESPVAPAADEAGLATAAPADEPKVAASVNVPPAASEAAPAEIAQAEANGSSAPPSAQADLISAKIAALDDSAQTIEPQRAKPASAAPDRSAIRKQLRARRAAHRRRLARLARLALARQMAQQQPFDLFGQPQPLAQPMTTAAAKPRKR
jgi:hypothetical protein